MNIAVFILLCITAFVSFVIYIIGLVNYVITSNLNVVLILITIAVNIISTFIMQYNLPKKIKNNLLILNLENKSNALSNYCSLILLTFFGISLLLDSIINEFDLLSLIVGIIILIVCLYENYIIMFKKDTIVFQVFDIEDYEDTKFYCVSLVNDDYGMLEYYTDNIGNIKMEHNYHCLISPYSKRVLKITNEVIDVK